MSAGARFDAVHRSGSTALMWAAFDDQVLEVVELPRADARVEAAENESQAALMQATRVNHGQAAGSRLLKQAAIVRANHKFRGTAPHVAVRENHQHLAQTL